MHSHVIDVFMAQFIPLILHKLSFFPAHCRNPGMTFLFSLKEKRREIVKVTLIGSFNDKFYLQRPL